MIQEKQKSMIDEFIETPVAAALESIGAGDVLEKLYRLFEDKTVKERSYRPPEAMTFGDLAVLITWLDLNSASSAVRQATVRQALEIFFTCFETAEKPDGETREGIKGIHNFLQMPFEDCVHYAEICGIPAAFYEFYDAYREENKPAEGFSSLTAYNEMKADMDSEQYTRLINMLVLPLAIINEMPFI